MSQSKLLNHAERVLQELKQDFLLDLPGRLDRIEILILALPQPPAFEEKFPLLLREIHSIKGIAGTYGVHVITSICHSLEDRLNRSMGVEDAAELPISEWLKYIDLIRQSIVHASTDNIFDEIEQTLFGLKSRGMGSVFSGLLVTSSKSITSLCQQVCVGEMNQFTMVDDGYQALGQILREKFDYLIASNEIGGLNGKALIAALRLSDSGNKNMPVVLLTSKNMPFTKRLLDPDYVVVRDASFMQNLSSVWCAINQKLQYSL